MWIGLISRFEFWWKKHPVSCTFRSVSQLYFTQTVSPFLTVPVSRTCDILVFLHWSLVSSGHFMVSLAVVLVKVPMSVLASLLDWSFVQNEPTPAVILKACSG